MTFRFSFSIRLRIRKHTQHNMNWFHKLIIIVRFIFESCLSHARPPFSINAHKCNLYIVSQSFAIINFKIHFVLLAFKSNFKIWNSYVSTYKSAAHQ